MRRLLGLLALSLSLAVSTPPAAADEGSASAILGSLLPFPDLSIDAGQVAAQDADRIVITDVVARLPGAVISLDRLTIDRVQQGIEISVGRFLMRSIDGAGVDILTGGSVLLSGVPRPDGGQDLLCRYARTLISARLGPTILNWGEERNLSQSGGLHQIRVASVDLTGDPDGISCRFMGEIDVGAVIARFDRDDSLEFDALRFDLDTPLDMETARADPGDMRIQIQAAGLERVTRGEVPSFGVTDMEVSLTAPARRAAALVYVLRGLLTQGGTIAPARLRMELWNATLLLAPDMQASLRGLRLFLPGIVPAGLVANFGRAGISNAQGNFDGSVSFRGDHASINGALDLLGVFSLGFQAGGQVDLIPAEVIRSILLSDQVSPASLSLLRLSGAALRYQDQGMDRIVNDLFGVPAGRLTEELGILLREGLNQNRFLDQAVEGMAYFLRRAAGGEALRLHLSATANAPVILPGDLQRWLSGEESSGRFSVSIQAPTEGN